MDKQKNYNLFKYKVFPHFPNDLNKQLNYMQLQSSSPFSMAGTKKLVKFISWFKLAAKKALIRKTQTTKTALSSLDGSLCIENLTEQEPGREPSIKNCIGGKLIQKFQQESLNKAVYIRVKLGMLRLPPKMLVELF